MSIGDIQIIHNTLIFRKTRPSKPKFVPKFEFFPPEIRLKHKIWFRILAKMSCDTLAYLYLPPPCGIW